MKQWLYYGWVTFKHWVLFTSWKFFHNKEDYYQLLKLYNESLFQKKQMAMNVAYLSRLSKYDEMEDFTGMNWYVGDLKTDRFEIVNEYYKQKAEEEKPKSD
jgi:hypothetical protein